MEFFFNTSLELNESEQIDADTTIEEQIEEQIEEEEIEKADEEDEVKTFEEILIENDIDIELPDYVKALIL